MAPRRCAIAYRVGGLGTTKTKNLARYCQSRQQWWCARRPIARGDGCVDVRHHLGGGHRLALAGERFVGLDAEELA